MNEKEKRKNTDRTIAKAMSLTSIYKSFSNIKEELLDICDITGQSIVRNKELDLILNKLENIESDIIIFSCNKSLKGDKNE